MEQRNPFARLRVCFLAVQIRFNDIPLSTAPAVINHISFTHFPHPQRTIAPKPGQVDPEDRSHITRYKIDRQIQSYRCTSRNASLTGSYIAVGDFESGDDDLWVGDAISAVPVG